VTMAPRSPLEEAKGHFCGEGCLTSNATMSADVRVVLDVRSPPNMAGDLNGRPRRWEYGMS
jgi:hypothetical protein